MSFVSVSVTQLFTACCRKAAEYLVSFMSVPFMLFSASRVMLYFDVTSSGWCVQVAGHVLFHVLFVPVLYHVAKVRLFQIRRLCLLFITVKVACTYFALCL